MLGPAHIKETTKSGNVILNAKIVRGVAHPPGEPDTYNGLKLTQKEIFEKYETLPGTLVYDNHDLSRPIGKVMSVSIGDDGELLMDALISKDYPHSDEVIERVLSGDYRGMSLGMDHKVNMDTGFVHESNIHELSLCPDGDMPGTVIRTVANDKNGIDKPFQTRWFDLDDNASTMNAYQVSHMDAVIDDAFGWLNRFKIGGGGEGSDIGRLSYEAGGKGENNNITMNKMTESAPYQSGIFSSEKGRGPFENNNNKEKNDNMSGSTTDTNTSIAPESAASPASGNTAGKFYPYPPPLSQNKNNAMETTGDVGAKERIMYPTEDDPYYRNALGQFASKPNENTNAPLGGGQQQSGASIASAMADAVRGSGFMPPSGGATYADGSDSSQSSSTTSHQQNASTSAETASTGTSAPADGVGGNGEPAEPASSQSSGGTSKRVAISQDDYSQLLDMKSQFEEIIKKQKESEEKAAEMQKKLKEWESIGATLGGSSDLEASKKVLEDLKSKEINKFLEKVDEIMPELDQIYKDSDGNEKQEIEKIIYALKNYQINRGMLKDPDKLAGARGLVEVVTKASRSYNTRFTEQEARIKELQRKHAETEKALVEERKRAEELSKKNSLYSQTGSSLSGANTIEPTFIGDRQKGKEPAPAHRNTNNSSIPSERTVRTTASSTGKRKTMMGGTPFERPPDHSSGYTYNELLQQSGGVQNLRTTASAGSGMSFDDYERKRLQETKRVKVSLGDYEDVPIYVRPWDPNQGVFSSLGQNYIGNATFNWIQDCIKSDSLVDIPACIRPAENDRLMDTQEAIRSQSIKRTDYWRS